MEPRNPNLLLSVPELASLWPYCGAASVAAQEGRIGSILCIQMLWVAAHSAQAVPAKHYSPARVLPQPFLLLRQALRSVGAVGLGMWRAGKFDVLSYIGLLITTSYYSSKGLDTHGV